MIRGLEQITASAGSGKTYTLTRRFLTLLAKALPDGGPSLYLLEDQRTMREGGGGYSLGGILAATFTNKAAAEMQARVIRELKRQALATDGGEPEFPLTPAEARRWVDVILRKFDAVNIRTIDSLLTMLVRLNSLSLALPPDFTPLFSIKEVLDPLYDGLLETAATEPDHRLEKLFRKACRSLLLHQRSKSLAAGNMLRNRLEEIIDLSLSGVELPSEEEGERALAVFMEFHSAFTDSATTFRTLCDDEGLSLMSNAQKYLEKCCATSPLKMPDFTSVFASRANIDDWLLKHSKGTASAEALRAFNDFRTACGRMAEQGPALLTTLAHMPFCILAEPLIQGINAVQEEEGLVPASRLAALALESLESGGVSEAFCRLGDSLAHLLFDEFQDTSTDQWQAVLPLVVECLSRGGSLTYVGDVKQAIYGWRNGNAELFDAVADDGELTAMLEDGAKRTSLTHNWRSSPAVVDTNNRVFGRLADTAFARRVLEAILPATVDEGLMARSARNLANAFSQCEQHVPEENRRKEGYVRLVRIEERHTQALLDSVKNRLENLLRVEILPRRDPGEIAILVRKNSEATLVAEWLTDWRIPVVTEHSFRLGNHPLITRLVDTLSFLEYPLDDVAFWSAMSGPELFGHTQENLADLADWLAGVREYPAGALFLAYKRDFPEIWEQTLAPFHDQAGLLSAYDTVCELIRHCRLYERFPEHKPFLQRFAEVAHAAENKGFSSLSAFLGFWAESGMNESVPMPESTDAVRILSIHKAKGLEFPVVLVPFHHQTEARHKPLRALRQNGLSLLTYRENNSEEAVRGVMEQINLLYVAWTRPSEELYAFITKSGHSSAHSAMGKALEALLEALPFTENIYAQGTQPAATSVCGPSIPGEAESQASCPVSLNGGPLMAWLPRLKIFRNSLDGKGFTERQRGLLAHACLEAFRLMDDDPQNLDADISKAVEQGMRAFPVPLPDPDAVKNDMASMLGWYASLPEAPVWLRYGSPEVPLMATDGSVRRIDLLVDEPGKDVLAVEYKTGQPSQEHQVQVKDYLALLGPAVKRRHARRCVAGVIVYLDLKKTVPVLPETVHA